MDCLSYEVNVTRITFECLLIDGVHNSGIIRRKYDTLITCMNPQTWTVITIGKNAVIKVFHISRQIPCSQWQPKTAQKPTEPAASVKRWKVCDVSQISIKKSSKTRSQKFGTFRKTNKAFHTQNRVGTKTWEKNKLCEWISYAENVSKSWFDHCCQGGYFTRRFNKWQKTTKVQ